MRFVVRMGVDKKLQRASLLRARAKVCAIRMLRTLLSFKSPPMQ
jgi:hypothetical protein